MKKARIMLSAILVLGVVGGAFAYNHAKTSKVLFCKFATGTACRTYENATTTNTGTEISCPSAAVTTLYYTTSACNTTPVQGFSINN